MNSLDNIKIKLDKTCKICLYNSIDYQVCKNTKCKVIICDDCLLKLKKEKCPYCTLDNCFSIDKIYVDSESSEDSYVHLNQKKIIHLQFKLMKIKL